MANTRLCEFPGCNKVHFGHGWCRTHYARWSKHGDPTITKKTPAGELKRYYRNVVLPYDGEACLFWPYHRSSSGYARMGDKTVSRLVCEEENGPPPTPRHEAAHSCGNGHLGCVARRHVRWKTPSENQMDRVAHGTSNRGERCGSARLTENDVRTIRIRSDERVGVLAREYGVTHGTIIAIRKRKSWAWLD